MKGQTGLEWDEARKTVVADDDWWERKLKENSTYKKIRNKDLSLYFTDIIATGECARATTQNNYLKMDWMMMKEQIMFPEPSSKKGKSIGSGTRSQVKNVEVTSDKCMDSLENVPGVGQWCITAAVEGEADVEVIEGCQTRADAEADSQMKEKLISLTRKLRKSQILSWIPDGGIFFHENRMMEVVICWNTRLVNCGIICLVLLIQSAFAEEGFLSIQCCAPANFTKPRTNLSWISDETWFPENQICISRQVYKNAHYEQARSFSSDIGHKWCYNLPTRKDHDYLVRGTFLSGNQEKTLPHSSFVVLIGVTPIATVKSSDELKVEGIFRATRSYTNFCLLKKKGNPYISKVELRPINPDYLKREPSEVLKLVHEYLDVVLKFRANRVVNLTMIKASNLSHLGPICNGYEILKTVPRVKETATEEVDIIVNVKKELLQHNKNNEILKSWSGDPCLPLPWPGLTCDRVNGTTVITQMNLSLEGLTGPSPLSIQKLTHLRKLYLSSSIHIGNKLSRSIKESNVTTDKGMINGNQNSRSAHKLVIGAAVDRALLVTFAIVISMVCFYKRQVMAGPKFLMRSYSITRNAVYSVPSTDTTLLKSKSIRNFKLDYIEAITQNYETLIGEGGFGSVYHGTLPNGEEVAVKVKSATSTQGIREFNNELNLLSAITHENLVPLLGYCCENEQQILVYPFMSNGSLQDRLYGLMYLHTFSKRCLIHRDVKSSNILLDQSMCAKIADFGFSKYASHEGDSGTSLEVRETAGYLDPDSVHIKETSCGLKIQESEPDSLFPLIIAANYSAMKRLKFFSESMNTLASATPGHLWGSSNSFEHRKCVLSVTSLIILTYAAKHLIRSSRVEEIVDPAIKGGYHGEALWRVVKVALACTETYSTYRPCIADIVRELEDALIIENNASEYLKSLDSFGGSNRFSIERSIVLPPIKSQIEPSSLLSTPAPPQPR
ncbi:hypothetical protein RND71_033069 [Anisodus tanguticus]|uniref:Protein kinase domain-containing protein n=1 Tax=Anisodus tanguticus TaxID=243964 RepID=A0AAE1R754_9SOLA|nr:hypothetical protein RND71_033069 [Anisodus tanguticus]